MDHELTLGSLFDGSGGFPLGGLLAGIRPVWASEIEPFPVRVTTKRLPFMKHYGDVSALDGAKLPPVDIITFGSPCQDMSIAGKRAGLDGERSGLFHQAIRIIKEMREKTNGKYPGFIVWENVAGAFSSNKGEDFRCVLEEICQIKAGNSSVPAYDRWPHAGCIMGDNFSVAWRLLSAEYWGVPQRRKRIYLVADFAGQSAGAILFESEGKSGYSAEVFRSWQRATRSSEDSTGEASRFDVGPYNLSAALTEAGLCANAGISTGCSAVMVVDSIGGRSETIFETNTAPTLRATHYKNPPCLLKAQQISYGIDRAAFNQGQNAQFNFAVSEEVEPTIVSRGPGAVCHPNYSSSKANYQAVLDEELAGALVASDYKDPPVVYKETGSICDVDYIVRRLTPVECARLQGFPDWWCDGLETPEPTEEDILHWRKIFLTRDRAMGKTPRILSDARIRKWLQNPYSDSAAYKLWGNGVALPNVYFVLSGIVWADMHN